MWLVSHASPTSFNPEPQAQASGRFACGCGCGLNEKSAATLNETTVHYQRTFARGRQESCSRILARAANDAATTSTPAERCGGRGRHKWRIGAAAKRTSLVPLSRTRAAACPLKREVLWRVARCRTSGGDRPLSRRRDGNGSRAGESLGEYGLGRFSATSSQTRAGT